MRSKDFRDTHQQIGHSYSNFILPYSQRYEFINETDGCTPVIRKFNPFLHKRTYRVGVYTAEGEELVYRNYNLTFTHYLTETVGQRFDPPIEFELVPVTLVSLMEATEQQEIDFFFSPSAVYSCMGSEYEAQPLVTIVSHREYRGHTYDLDKYGGVMFTLADNDSITSIADFKDKIIGAGGITSMGAAQAQIYELLRNGFSYVLDPKQVVFTHDGVAIVQGVLDGDFEVGFARTDQIERHTDENGELIDPGK